MDAQTQDRLKEIKFDVEQLNKRDDPGIKLLIEHVTWFLQLVREFELAKYKYQCSGCGHFTKFYSGTCPECNHVGYLSGSFKREDLEKWFDALEALE